VRSLINPRQTSPIDYADSPLNARADDSAQFKAGPSPGSVLLECPLEIVTSDTTRAAHLTDLIGPCFTALCFTEDGRVPTGVSQLDAVLARDRVPFAVVAIAQHPAANASGTVAVDSTGRLFPMFDAHPGTQYLIRPDGHVLGRWRAPDCDRMNVALQDTLHGTQGSVQ
jgi:3-(3-hydroxy-phenyl)propionate hydroxylase